MVSCPPLWLFVVILASEAFPLRAGLQPHKQHPSPVEARRAGLSVPVSDMPSTVLFLLRLWSGKSCATHKVI